VEDREVCNVFGNCRCTANYTGNKCTECVETCEKQDGKCVPKANCDAIPGTKPANTDLNYRGGDAGLASDGVTYCKCPTDYKWDYLIGQCIPAPNAQCGYDLNEGYNIWKEWNRTIEDECGYGYVAYHYEKPNAYVWSDCRCTPRTDMPIIESYEYKTVKGHEYVYLYLSDVREADAFCKAFGKKQVSFADMGCSIVSCANGSRPIDDVNECSYNCAPDGLWQYFATWVADTIVADYFIGTYVKTNGTFYSEDTLSQHVSGQILCK